MGAGGAIIVQQGGTLAIAGTLSVNGNAVVSGAGGAGGTFGPFGGVPGDPGTDGSAFGNGIFLQGDNSSGFGSGGLIFMPGPSQNQTVADVIADQTGSGGTGANAGSVGITKNGAGTLFLSGANTYSGTTWINQGTLNVSGSLSNSSVTVSFGIPGAAERDATLTGTGMVKSATVRSGGTLTGNLTVPGGVTFESGSIFSVTLNSNSSYTQLSGGAVDLTAAPTLKLILQFTPAVGTVFTIIPGTVTGKFKGLPEGAVFSVNGVYFRINYGSVKLTCVIPPPVITSPANANGTYGAPFTYAISATNSPTTYDISGNVPGVTINTATGIISFTPNHAGVFSVAIIATNTTGSGTAVLVITIAKASTTTTLATTYTGALAATVRVVAPGGGTPTGTVQFLKDGAVASTVALVGLTAEFPRSPGTFTAVYSGDGNFNGSTSNGVTIYPPATSSLSLSSSPNPSTLGQAVTFTATIRTSGGSPFAGSPTGTVEFTDGTKLLGRSSVSGGQATYTTSALTGGSHSITAQYSGDSTWPTASDSCSQMVFATVTMSVTAAPSATVYGQSVVVTALVGATSVPAGFAPPTGQVTFSLPGAGLFWPPTPLGAAPLESGTATFSVNALPVGTQTITAQYSGDSAWSSASRTVTATVSPALTSMVVSSTIASGQVVLTGVVAPAAPGAGTPTGTVQFVDTSQDKAIASAALSGGRASANLAPNAASIVIGRPISAVYSGDGNFKQSQSAPLPAMTNAAVNSTAGAISADEIVSIFGVAGLNGDILATQPLPTSLGGVTVDVMDSAGTGRLAFLYGVFASAGQINFMVPSGMASGLAVVTITLPGGGAITTVVNIEGKALGIFTANMTGGGAYAGHVIYVRADGSQTVANSTVLDSSGKTFVPNPIHLAAPGEQVYLVLYGTGIRHADSLTATVNGVSVPMIYFGAHGLYAGLDQINLGPLPGSLAGAGTVNIGIAADGQTANTVTARMQ